MFQSYSIMFAFFCMMYALLLFGVASIAFGWLCPFRAGRGEGGFALCVVKCCGGPDSDAEGHDSEEVEMTTSSKHPFIGDDLEPME